MKLSDILSNISSRLGISSLKPMQQALADEKARRVLLVAPTGSGKTLSFAIYMLRRLSGASGTTRGLIIAPSRELVLQITEVMRAAAAPLKVTAVYGGHRMEDEKNSLSPAPDIIIATPGRLVDHLNRGQVDLSHVEVLVLDEYDKCIDLGFERDLRKIVRSAGHPEATVLTSATSAALPEWIGADGWKTLSFNSGSSTEDSAPGRLDIVHVPSASKDKADTLIDLLRSMPQGKAIVFVNHRESADRLHALLRKAGDTAALYHGALDQHDRQTAVALLTNGSAPVLVATDLAARGLDITGVDAVIHYHLPTSPEAWTHRNGRTARNGADGTAYVITSEADDIPPYVDWQREYVPKPGLPPRAPQKATIHFNAGRKEKISRGDIAGFLMANAPLTPDEISAITVSDHEALAAVPAEKIDSVIKAVTPLKVKNRRVKISRLYPSFSIMSTELAHFTP